MRGPTGTAVVSGAYVTTLNVAVDASYGLGGIGEADTKADPNLSIYFGSNSDGNMLSAPAFSAGVTILASSPQTGTFTSSNTYAAGSEFSLPSSSGGVSSAWQQEFSADQGPAATGTFNLTVSSAGSLGGVASVSQPWREEWLNPHGTYSVTLPASPGGSSSSEGSVSVNITF